MTMQHSRLSLPPFTVLGHRGNGRPIYNIAGGSAPAGEQAPQAGDAPPPAAPPAAPPATPPATTPPAAPEWDGKIESLPPAAQKLLADARAEAGNARTNAKKQAADEARTELLKQLGLSKEGEPTQTPEQLAEKLASREAQLYTMRVETALAKSAKAHGADEDLVTAVLAHEGKLDELDPDSTTFAAELDALVKAAVEGNPKLKAAQAAGVSGGQFTGGSGEGKQRPTSIGAALTAQAAKS